MRVLRLVLTLAFSVACCPVGASPEEREAEVSRFATEMAEQHGFDREALLVLLSKARFRDDIIEAMQRPAEAKPWYQYKPIFVTTARTRAGVQFWRDNEALLDRVEREYGVPPEIIVAIVGVETRYGGYTGKHRVLDALSTLAFGYPKRAPFFRKQLEEFLLLTREEGVDPLQAKGSYAGAMGVPQFIPSSYREYAVDFDGDGKRDLWDSNADVIGSVANYFKRHGWRKGEPVALKASAAQPPGEDMTDAGLKPSLPLGDLSRKGLQVEADLPDGTLVSLVRLENKNDVEYWLGLDNFYVITRYNHSQLYAMAVYQLSQEILAVRAASRDEFALR